jgi:hypothetical protein
MDSGFWSAKLLRRLRQHQVRYSITVRQTKTVRAAIAAIPEQAWIEIPYVPDGVAEVAETAYQGDRLVVRRVRNLDDQQQLFATWRYHAFVTNRVGTMLELDQDHRRHAVCELAIRDLKAGAGLAHLPSGRFAANAAWLGAATLAHNLIRWTATLGLGIRDQQTVAKTLRRTLLALPGRLTRSARQWTLHLPAEWPWAHSFRMARRGCAASRTRPDRTPTSRLGWSAARRPLRPARHGVGRTTQPRNDQQPTLTRHLLRLRRHATRAPARCALGRVRKPATALPDRWIQAQVSPALQTRQPVPGSLLGRASEEVRAVASRRIRDSEEQR